DARLREATNVRHLRLELDALRVLRSQVVDRGGAEVCEVARFQDACTAVVGHAYLAVPSLTMLPLVGSRYQAASAFGACSWCVNASAQHPAALSVGYGSIRLPLSPPMRISKWRWGAVALPVMPVSPMTSPLATGRASPTNCERCA